MYRQRYEFSYSQSMYYFEGKSGHSLKTFKVSNFLLISLYMCVCYVCYVSLLNTRPGTDVIYFLLRAL